MRSSRLFWQLLLLYGGLNLMLAILFLVALPAIIPDTRGVVAVSLFVLCGTIVIGAVCYYVAWHVGRPLDQVARAMQAISDGRYTNSVSPPSDRNAVREFVEAFVDMQTQLSRRVGDLRDDNQRMKTVLSGMVEGVLAVDAGKHVLLANDACKSLLGIAHERVVGRPLLEVARNAELNTAVVEAFQHEGPHQREIVLAGPPRRLIGLLATALTTDAGQVVVIVMHDVTDLRRLENLRRDFVANVSHELKTPLSSIKAYAETLRMGAINDPEHNVSFVDRISAQAERLHQLIVDLLQLARVEAGQEAFQMEHVDLAALAERCLMPFRELAEQRQLTLRSEPADEPLTVWADAEGLFTILNNLLDNAVKYTPAGGTIVLRWYRDQANAVLEVQDTGVGIEPEDQERVFERFYRIDKARSREMGGTGLGLAIVKHLAQSFGGGVGLESEPRRGSTFRVVLPRERGLAKGPRAAPLASRTMGVTR